MSDADFDALLADLEGSVKIDDDPISAQASVTIQEPEWNSIMIADIPPPPPPSIKNNSSPRVTPSSPKSVSSPRQTHNAPSPRPTISSPSNSPRIERKPPSIARPPSKSGGGKTVFYKIEGEKEHKIQTLIKLYLTSKDDEDFSAPVDIHKITARLEGPERVKASISEVDIGRFEMRFSPSTIGEYRVIVEVDGKSLFGDSPLKIKVVEKFAQVVDTMNFTMEGKGLKGARVGDPVSFSIHVEDSKGNKKQINASDLSVIIGTGTSRIYASISPAGAGTYKATYTTKVAGSYPIDVLYKDKSVLSSPGHAVFSAPADASTSVLVGVPPRVAPYANAFFTIQAKNNLGLVVKIGGDPFNVEVAGPAEAQNLSVADNNNGTYTVRFMLPVAGKYSFHVQLGGREICGSPADINV